MRKSDVRLQSFNCLSRDDVRKRSVRESLSHATIRRSVFRLFHHSTNPILYQSDSSFNKLLSYGFAGGCDLFEKYGRCGFFLLVLRVRALLANAGVRTLLVDGMYACRELESRGSQAHRARPRDLYSPLHDSCPPSRLGVASAARAQAWSLIEKCFALSPNPWL